MHLIDVAVPVDPNVPICAMICVPPRIVDVDAGGAPAFVMFRGA